MLLLILIRKIKKLGGRVNTLRRMQECIIANTTRRVVISPAPNPPHRSSCTGKRGRGLFASGFPVNCTPAVYSEWTQDNKHDHKWKVLSRGASQSACIDWLGVMVGTRLEIAEAETRRHVCGLTCVCVCVDNGATTILSHIVILILSVWPITYSSWCRCHDKELTRSLYIIFLVI